MMNSFLLAAGTTTFTEFISELLNCCQINATTCSLCKQIFQLLTAVHLDNCIIPDELLRVQKLA